MAFVSVQAAAVLEAAGWQRQATTASKEVASLSKAAQAAGEQLRQAQQEAGERLRKAQQEAGEQLRRAQQEAGEQLTKAQQEAGEQLRQAHQQLRETQEALKEQHSRAETAQVRFQGLAWVRKGRTYQA